MVAGMNTMVLGMTMMIVGINITIIIVDLVVMMIRFDSKNNHDNSKYNVMIIIITIAIVGI